MEMSQITWQYIRKIGYLARGKLAVRNSLVVICISIACDCILQTKTTAMKCYITLTGMALTGVALVMARSPTTCWSTPNITYPKQEKNAVKSFTNGITTPVQGPHQSWNTVNTILIGLEVRHFVQMTSTKYPHTWSTIKLGISLRRSETAARDTFTGIWTSAWALKL